MGMHPPSRSELIRAEHAIRKPIGSPLAVVVGLEWIDKLCEHAILSWIIERAGDQGAGVAFLRWASAHPVLLSLLALAVYGCVAFLKGVFGRHEDQSHEPAGPSAANASRPIEQHSSGDKSPNVNVGGTVQDSSVHVGDVHHHYNQESPRPEQPKPLAPVVESQLREITRIEEFITRKDEWSLRVTFDLPDNMKYAILGIRHSLDKTTATPESVEELKKFSEGGRGIMDKRFMMPLGRDFRGTIMTGKPGCFWAINLSKKHVDARTTLSGFCASTQLPSSIIEPLKALDAAADDNVNLILATVNEHLALDKRFVLEADTITSPYVGKITTTYGARFIRLRPKADDIATAIRKYLGVS
jgi:hypothetical protein